MGAEPPFQLDSCPRCRRSLPGPRPAVNEIIAAVAGYSGFSPLDLISKRREIRLMRARHLAMWLTRQLRPDLSFPKIGREFNRDHSSVLQAIQRFGTHTDDRGMDRRDPITVWLEITNG